MSQNLPEFRIRTCCPWFWPMVLHSKIH